MKTRDLIKDESLLLFNERGLMNVNLRGIAKKLNKSYGNITYHFTNKEQLIKELFEDMNKELTTLQTTSDQTSLMAYFFELPNYSYDITIKYLFFTKDYIELKRNYPEFMTLVTNMNSSRKKTWATLLVDLRNQGYLNGDLTNSDLDYIMFLSGSVRAAYFQMMESSDYKKPEYEAMVNRLLIPYLSSKGLDVFSQYVGT